MVLRYWQKIFMLPAKVVMPEAAPMVSVFAFRFTAAPVTPLSEATDWLAPSANVEVASMVTSVRAIEVGNASVTLAFSVTTFVPVLTFVTIVPAGIFG